MARLRCFACNYNLQLLAAGVTVPGIRAGDWSKIKVIIQPIFSGPGDQFSAFGMVNGLGEAKVWFMADESSRNNLKV